MTVKCSLEARVVAVGAVGAIWLAGWVAPALAQETPLSGIYACTDQTSDTARLACFDAAVAALRADEEEGEVAVVTSERIEQVAEESFGRPGGADLAAVAPKVAAASAARSQSVVETPDEVTLKVVKIDEQRDGKIWLTMDNGQVWRQTTGGRPRYRGKGPWEAEISKGAIGGFRLKLDGGRPIRVTRED